MPGEDGLDMADRRRLADRVDQQMRREECETGIDWFQTDGRATVTSYSPAIVRSLLKHSEARLCWIYATGSAEHTGRVQNPSLLLGSDASVEGVQVTIPVGALGIKGVVRASNKDSGVVHTPEDADEAREAFADGGVVEGVGIEVGAVVEDRDAMGRRDRMVVINTPTVPADEFDTRRPGVTVADENPGYDPKSKVAVCVARDELEDARPVYTGDSPLELAEVGLELQKYPAGRLRRVGEL